MDDPEYSYAPEGWPFVRLAVEPRDDENLLVCAGGWNSVTYYEEWFGDDTTTPCPCPTVTANCPKIRPGQHRLYDRYESRPYLAVLTIGSTGWVGYRKSDHKPFVSRYEHLTVK